MGFFEYLPAYELNRSPRIIAAFEMDFLRNLSAFQRSIPKGEKFTLLLQLGWSAELPEVAAELKSRLAEAREAFPEARFIILANAPGEVEIIKEFCEVYLASHNAFLDPRRYPLARAGAKKFSALYIARITPFKRHELACKVENLHLIGSFSSTACEASRTGLLVTVSTARRVGQPEPKSRTYIPTWTLLRRSGVRIPIAVPQSRELWWDVKPKERIPLRWWIRGTFIA